MDVFDTAKFSLSIHIDTPVVFPGSIVSGHLKVTTQGPVIDVVAIRIKLVGKESHQRRVFTGNSSGEGKPQTEIITDKSVVYKCLQTLWGQPKDTGCRSTGTVPGPAEFCYPFEFQLPMSVPSSFATKETNGSSNNNGKSSNKNNSSINGNDANDDKASLNYFVKAYVDMPYGRDAKTRTPVYVLSTMPLRQWQERCPMGLERSWEVSRCGCCGSLGATKSKFSIDRTVLALDRDALVGQVEVDNSNCKGSVEKVTMRLVSKARVRVRNQSGYIERCCGAVSETVDIGSGQSGSVTLTLPLVPALVPPSIATHTVQNTFEVQFELEVPGLSSNDTMQCFPVLVAYTVDNSNQLMAINTNACVFADFNEAARREYLWRAPAQPMVAPAVIPAQVPVPAASSQDNNGGGGATTAGSSSSTPASAPTYGGGQTTTTLVPHASATIQGYPDPKLWGAPALPNSNSSDNAAANSTCTEWKLPETPLRTVEAKSVLHGGACGSVVLQRSTDARSSKSGRGGSFKSDHGGGGGGSSFGAGSSGSGLAGASAVGKTDDEMARADSELIMGSVGVNNASMASNMSGGSNNHNHHHRLAAPMPTQNMRLGVMSSNSGQPSRRSSMASRNHSSGNISDDAGYASSSSNNGGRGYYNHSAAGRDEDNNEEHHEELKPVCALPDLTQSEANLLGDATTAAAGVSIVVQQPPENAHEML